MAKRGPIKTDEIAELTEPLLDEGIKKSLEHFAGYVIPEIAGELPAGKLVLVVGRAFRQFQDAHMARMLLKFLEQMRSGDKSFEEFTKLPNETQDSIRSLVISQIQLQSDPRQAEATGLVVNAHLAGKITNLDMIGLVSEIKSTNPLLYYFAVDSISIESSETGEVRAFGNTSLLPAAFGHNTVSGIGLLGSTGDYKFVLSEMGKQFFEHAYQPMNKKYQI